MDRMTKEEAVEFVKRFFRMMEERDLEQAEMMMKPGALITFPGGVIFRSQREMVEASRDRYQWIKKTFDQAEVLEVGPEIVVYIRGTLYGVNRYGQPFEGIRYIDRFVIEDGGIVQQDVWNDLAESKALGRS